MASFIPARGVPGRLALIAAATLGSAVTAAPAVAATSHLGCRASLGGAAGQYAHRVVEPFVANPAVDPCTSTSVAARGTVGSEQGVPFWQQNFGPWSADATVAGGASTVNSSAGKPPYVIATANVSWLRLRAPGATVIVSGATAQTIYSCVNHALSAGGSSHVGRVYVNGKGLPGDKQLTSPIGPNGSYLTLNRTIDSPTSLTQQIAYVHLVGVGNFTIGDATVTHDATPCA